MLVNECDARVECVRVRDRGSQGGFEGAEEDVGVGAGNAVEVMSFRLTGC